MSNTDENNRFELFILRISAGNHPVTGERLPTDSLWLKNEITDAVRQVLEKKLKSSSESLEGIKRNTNRKNMGERWSKEQETQLASLWAENVQISEIAQIMGRSRGGITSRLNKMCMVQSESNNILNVCEKKDDYLIKGIKLDDSEELVKIVDNRDFRCEECDAVIPKKRLE